MKVKFSYKEPADKSDFDANSPRAGDPKEWACLSDEQREIINSWYIKDRFDFQRTFKRELDNKYSYSLIMAAVPFAVYFSAKAMSMGQNFIKAALEFIAALIVFSLLAYLGIFVGNHAQECSLSGKLERILRFVGVALAYAAVCWVFIALVRK